MDASSLGIPFYEEGRYLLESAIKYWNKYTYNRAVAELAKANEMLINPHLYQYLKWRYRDYPILERAGETYPVVVFPASEEQRKDPESVLLGLEKQVPESHPRDPRDARYRALLRKVGRPLVDRPTFTMKSMVTTPNLGMYCQLGSYFRLLDTCDALQFG